MSSEIAIRIRNLSKHYRIYDNPRDRLKQMIFGGRRTFYREFKALDGISFDVPRGETVGVVGRNGSGKSTLLQIIAGTLSASGGSVQAQGRIAALLELGSGFNSEFTGRENVYLNAALLGLSHEEIDQRFDSIAAFADIGQFLDQPVKTYSSGMLVRLAFAVQAQVDPEILIVDEALAVGDAKFQAKCFDRLTKLKETGASILLVTHSSEQVVTHCSSAVLLDAGQMVMQGKPRDVVNKYLDVLFGKERKTPGASSSEPADSTQTEPSKHPAEWLVDVQHDNFAKRPLYNAYEYRWGDGLAEITDFHLASDGVAFPAIILNGATVTLQVGVKILSPLTRPILGVTIKTKDGVTLYGSNSELLECAAGRDTYPAGSTLAATVTFTCALGAGDFFISLGLATRDAADVTPHDRRYDAIHITVGADTRFFGLTNLNMNMNLE